MGRRSGAVDALVVCPPGLERVVAAELAGLGVARTRAEKGGVSCHLTTRQLYAANATLRCATRVLVRAAGFTARSFADLERRIAEVDWSAWLDDGTTTSFRVTTRRSRLWHAGAVEERFASQLHGAGTRAPAQLVVVRAVADRFTVSIDSSGDPLHRRGWRLDQAKAPLRETVAAGILLAAGWDPSTPLVDPMCGSGTIAIEAAMLASGLAPGAGRSFAFQGWPSFQPGTWASVAGQLRSRVVPPVGRILASDRDAGAVEAATANAVRAGVADRIAFRQASVSDLQPADPSDPPGLLATNPPWGGRLSAGGDLRNLYATLGRVAGLQLPGWSIGLLVADRALARQVRPGLSETLSLELGGRRAWLLTGRLG